MDDKAPKSAPQPSWNALTNIVKEYLDSYEMRDGETVEHTPTAHEKALLDDAISGLIGDERFIDAMQRKPV